MRALHPHIGARVALDDGTTLGVLVASVSPERPPTGELAERAGRLVLGCVEGGLELLRVRPAGGRPMDAAEYLRGHRHP